MLKKKCLLLLTSLFIAGGTASYCHAQVYSQPANDTPVLYGENNQIVQPVRVVAEATGASEQDAIASAKRQAVESLITKLISSSQYKQQVYQLAYSFDKYVSACHVSQKDDVANGVAIKTKVDIYQELLERRVVLFGAQNAAGKQHWVVINGFTGGIQLTPAGFSIQDPGSNSRGNLQQLMNEYPTFYKFF